MAVNNSGICCTVCLSVNVFVYLSICRSGCKREVTYHFIWLFSHPILKHDSVSQLLSNLTQKIHKKQILLPEERKREIQT